MFQKKVLTASNGKTWPANTKLPVAFLGHEEFDCQPGFPGEPEERPLQQRPCVPSRISLYQHEKNGKKRRNL